MADRYSPIVEDDVSMEGQNPSDGSPQNQAREDTYWLEWQQRQDAEVVYDQSGTEPGIIWNENSQASTCGESSSNQPRSEEGHDSAIEENEPQETQDQAAEVQPDLETYRLRYCELCQISFDYAGMLDTHRWQCHRDIFYPDVQLGEGVGLENEVELNEIELEDSLFNGLYRDYKLDLDQSPAVFKEINGLMHTYHDQLYGLLLRNLQAHRGIRVTMCMNVDMVRKRNGVVVDRRTFPIVSFLHTILHPSMITNTLKIITRKLDVTLENLVQCGSGWEVERIRNLEVRILAYQPTGGSSYIPTPTYIARKHGVLNIKNLNDEMCFVWSVLAGITKYYLRVTTAWATNVNAYRRFLHKINIDDLEFPVTIEQIDRFLVANPTLSINVFAYDEEGEEYLGKDGKTLTKPCIYPIYVAGRRTQQHVDLLLLDSNEKTHFVLIRQSATNPQEGLSRLLGHIHGRGHRYCQFCLQPFLTAETLERHSTYCANQGLQKTTFPQVEFFKFVRWNRLLDVGFTVIADFECLLERVPRQRCGQSSCDRFRCECHHGQKTRFRTKHVPSGYGMVIIDHKDNLVHAEVFNGQDAHVNFLWRLIELTRPLFKKLKSIVPPQPVDIRRLQNDRCVICLKMFDPDYPQHKRVLHHSHLDGTVYGRAHATCNLLCKQPPFINVIFHNGESYDNSLILQAIRPGMFKKVSGIARSQEKVMTMTLQTLEGFDLRIIDSMKFLQCSLQSLVNEASADPSVFHITRNVFQGHPGDVTLLYSKGIFPYNHMDSFARLDETCLPPKAAFKSDLTESDISDADYQHAQRVWQSFQCRTMRDYTSVYCMSDCTLLCDVWIKFKNEIRESHRLNVNNYVSLPGVAYDAAIVKSGVQLEFIRDPDLWQLWERAKRGGISQVGSLCRATANNPYLGPDLFDPTKETSYLVLWDCNSLYSWSQSHKLAARKFRDVTDEWKRMTVEQAESRILALNENDEDGFLLEVDLYYPPELHYLHRDLPCAPQRMRINFSQLSPYSKDLAESIGMTQVRSDLNSEKLVCHLGNRQHYVTHGLLLRTYLRLGLRLTAVHRVCAFEQEAWVKPYIDFCAQKRAASNSKITQTFQKYMMNVVSGKLSENKRKWTNAVFILDEQTLRRYMNKANLKNVVKIEGSNILMLSLSKPSVCLDRFLPSGVSQLEISKIKMYEFHYGYVKALYTDNSWLCSFDTDGATYLIVAEDVYRDALANHDTWFDHSDYPSDTTDPLHTLYNNSHKKWVGYFKDENSKDPIYSIVCLKTKLYAILTRGHALVAKVRGITHAAVKNQMTFDNFVSVLEQGVATEANMKVIRSYRHQLYTVALRKKALSSFDAKRFYIDEYNSIPHASPWLVQGHYSEDRIVAFDCEMVKSKMTGRLVAGSVSIVNFQGHSIYEVKVKHSPGTFVIDSWSLMINGFRHFDLENGQPFDNVREMVSRLLTGCLVVIAGGDVQKKMDFDCLDLDVREFDVFDIHAYWKRLNQTKFGQKLQPISLRDIYYYYYGFDLQSGVHSCTEDARATMRLFREHYVPRGYNNRYYCPENGFQEIQRVLPKRTPIRKNKIVYGQ